MESFRSEENHPFTKDAFLITLFDMRNQSARLVSLLNNKGKKKQPPSKNWKGVQSGCGCPDDYFRWFHSRCTSLRFSRAETQFKKNAKCKVLFFRENLARKWRGILPEPKMNIKMRSEKAIVKDI
ncbi:hypothetical protein CDAR_177551 [Caerostris darwini]|uniref:Uncharacterized protein n=1 Tax=Caerostris darwini TaxID=1538125 RepID=A0AAV4P1Q9_9ARAC|nr:hypothetical protein CDAR_177551 [Caerostris darwini]